MQVSDTGFDSRPFEILEHHIVRRVGREPLHIYVTSGEIFQLVSVVGTDSATVQGTTVEYASTTQPFHHDELNITEFHENAALVGETGSHQRWKIAVKAMFFFTELGEPLLLKIQPIWRDRRVGDMQAGKEYENTLVYVTSARA